MLELGTIIRPKKSFKRTDGNFSKGKRYVIFKIFGRNAIGVVSEDSISKEQDVVFFDINPSHINHIWKFFNTKKNRAISVIKKYGRKTNRDDITKLYK